MRVLWVSSIAWKTKDGYDYPVNGPGAVSGSIFQQSMITGLEEAGVEVDLLIDYPYSGLRFSGGRSFSHREKSTDRIIPSCNIPYFSIPFKCFFIQREIRKMMKSNQYDYVIAYLIHSPFLEGIKAAKKIDDHIKSVLICPDLPDMMDMSLRNKKIKKLFKEIDYKRINKLYDYVDSFVLFSELMKEKLPVEEKPWTVIEGIATVDTLDLTCEKKSKAMMYAGTLHKNIGIENIIASLQYLPADLEFWIFGDGELKEEIIKLAQEDERIKFFGFMPREEVFAYEKRAAVLINARNPEDSFTRYSFPSKTFEYLYSGTPFVTTKLTGVPEEYNDYLYLLSDNDPRTIADKVLEVLNTDRDVTEDQAQKARDFIKNKGRRKQAEKLFDFIVEKNETMKEAIP